MCSPKRLEWNTTLLMIGYNMKMIENECYRKRYLNKILYGLIFQITTIIKFLKPHNLFIL